MSIYASKTNNGFYDSEIHALIPDDAIEIGRKLHEELLAAQSNGRVIDWSGVVPVAVFPPPPTLIERRAQRLAEINSKAASLLASLSAAYPDGEVQSWGQQTREAEALSVNLNAPAPLLTTIASTRGLPLSELAARVRKKVQAYAVASGQIIGQRQALEDAIHAVDLAAPNAAAQLEAIKWPA